MSKELDEKKILNDEELDFVTGGVAANTTILHGKPSKKGQKSIMCGGKVKGQTLSNTHSLSNTSSVTC